jgi:DNA-binding CsgD family transcriptional regulator
MVVKGRRAAAEASFANADNAMTVPVPMPHYRHTARLLVAEAAIADGWGRPESWLQDDLIYFDQIGHQPLAARCRSLLRQSGARVPRRTSGPDIPDALRRLGVTGREMEVLQLITQGLSNREIAARLVLSTRTIEKHVERLLAKTASADRTTLRDTARHADGP